MSRLKLICSCADRTTAGCLGLALDILPWNPSFISIRSSLGKTPFPSLFVAVQVDVAAVATQRAVSRSYLDRYGVTRIRLGEAQRDGLPGDRFPLAVLEGEPARVIRVVGEEMLAVEGGPFGVVGDGDV